jgi:hypothetical protein
MSDFISNNASQFQASALFFQRPNDPKVQTLPNSETLIFGTSNGTDFLKKTEALRLRVPRPEIVPFIDIRRRGRQLADLRLIKCLKTASTNQRLHIAYFYEF